MTLKAPAAGYSAHSLHRNHLDKRRKSGLFARVASGIMIWLLEMFPLILEKR
jgi:hypothetical protein